MPKILFVALFVFLSVSSAVCQTQSADIKTMSDADYKTFLLQVEAALPKWETSFKSINLDKTPNLSYSVGKSIADSQIVALTEIDNLHTFIHFQQRKRTVYGELALKGFLDSLYDMAEQILWRETLNGLTLSDLEKYGPQMSVFSARVGFDAMERVRLLEKGTCP